MADRFDVAVIGAGAAGMMCAAVAGQRGRSVVLLDHSTRLAEKIRISGGGRCNFTNREVGVEHFVGEDAGFARAALAGYSSSDFIGLVRRHGIGYHEKHRGQLFCDDSSDRIIALLVDECAKGHVAWRRPVRIVEVHRAESASGFRIDTDAGSLAATRVVVATGGLSIPKIGATDFAFRTAKRFGLRIVEPRPALVPLTFAPESWAPFAALSGLALEVDVRCADGWHPRGRAGRFREDLLFTHRGVSGPAVLQVSSFWKPGTDIVVDLVPAIALSEALLADKAASRQNLAQLVGHHVPRRLAAVWLEHVARLEDRRIAEVSNASLLRLADSLKAWKLRPDGTEGYRKAEVTAGGVATDELSPDSLESHRVPGLHFIGEAVDVTGWLGGYNFQWAWSSGVAAGRSV